MSGAYDPVLDKLLACPEQTLFDVQTMAEGPTGSLPLSGEMLRDWASGHLFGLTQNVGMGWRPEDLLGPVLLFASQASGFVTGQILTIDGGLTATQ